MVKLRVNGVSAVNAAEGNGPVNALDMALRKTLETFYPSLGDMRLMDYKVRVLDPESATAAMVRVMITSTDGKASWTTVGVSVDILHASLIALVDSIEYKLAADAAAPKPPIFTLGEA
jgi:2-isopropylmalate synthase